MKYYLVEAEEDVGRPMLFDEMEWKEVKPIPCKALRKKGTDKWYSISNDRERFYVTTGNIPQTWGLNAEKELIEYEFSPLPEDAELVELLIIQP